eukprot:758090_1
MASEEKTYPTAPIAIQQFPSLHDSLRTNLNGIIDNEEFGDVTFIVDGVEFSGIRALFAAQSQVFRTMLFGNYSESVSKDKPVLIGDMTPSAFKYIRSMFYFQNPKLTCDIVVDVLYASRIYFIHTLVTKCHQFLLNIEQAKNWYHIMHSFAKYPESTFYPFFKTFIQSCKALNIANGIQQQHNHNNKINEINNKQRTDHQLDYSNHKDSNYYYDKYLLLNDHSFEEYLKCWQILEMLKCGINDEKMYKACLRWSNEWQGNMHKFIHYFDFNKFNVDYICDEMQFISKDRIINILRKKLSNHKPSALDTNDEKSESHSLDDANGFRMNEMLLSDSDLSSLRVGDKIDHRDYKGRWCKATITQKQFIFIKLHYVGWNSQYDCWIHISEDYEKLAKYGRITRRQVQRKQLQNLKVSDKVLIRLPSCHRFHYMSWIKGNVSYIEEDTGQIKFAYGLTSSSDAKYSWWTHPDNMDECKPYRAHHVEHNDREEVKRNGDIVAAMDDTVEKDNNEDDDTVSISNIGMAITYQVGQDEEEDDDEQVLTYHNFEDHTHNTDDGDEEDAHNALFLCD